MTSITLDGNESIVTTSWDDGHRKDLEVAKLLEKHNLPGTFYIAPESALINKDERLSRREIVSIGKRFEVGGHTRTHPDLSRLPAAEATSEISSGREILEEITGKKITSFCYPYGAYNEETPLLLNNLGFSFARTVEQFKYDIEDPLSAGTTVHCLSHHYKNRRAITLLRAAGFDPVKAWRCLDWDMLAKTLFDTCRNKGGIFHLWGHSWEIDERNDWDRLDEVLSYISNHEDVTYVTNAFFGRK